MKNRKIKELLFVLAVPIIFLVVGTFVLKDYGINWDEPFHFMRGQAYLNFFLNGKKDYSNLSPYPRLSDDCPEWAKGKCNISPGGATDVLSSENKGIVYKDAIKLRYPQGLFKLWRSLYQHDVYDFNSIIKSEGGHPPLNDILAAFTNYVVFQRLHLLGDDETYHFFEVLAGFSIVLGVTIFVYKKFDTFSAIVAGASLGMYPLFFSESHFNIKDPPEAAFYGLTIILFYLGIAKNNWKIIIASAFFSALALGTKFNALFLAPLFAVWLMFHLITHLPKNRKIFSKKNIRQILPVVLSLIVYPFITLGIFFLLWPYLWQDPIKNIMSVVAFYEQIGTGVPSEMAPFIIHGWNTYPILWIIYTTPIPILFLSTLGFIRALIKSVKGDSLSFLLVLWFFVPILRVSWPHAGIYGGVRQIMEYIPGMAVLAGVGTYTLLKAVKNRFGKKSVFNLFFKIIIVASLLFVLSEMVKIHPNENVYFNQLIGGLSGAKARNIPSWGNAYGNVYLQGVNWINQNAEPNAKLGLAVSTMGNIPKLELRSDIDFYNGNYSGLDRLGEYEIEMDFDWWPKYFYSFQYLDTYLEPVYTVSVDGVPLLKVWKNDLAHTKESFKKETTYSIKNVDFSNNKILVDLGKEIYLTSIQIGHSSSNCEVLKSGYIEVSTDKVNWQRELDPLEAQVPNVVKKFNKNNFIFLFPALKSRYILVDPLSANSCISKLPKFEVKGLEVSP